MASEDTITVLVRLSVILNRSLPMYLADARPYSPGSHSAAADVLDSIAQEQREMVERINRYIADEGGRIDRGAYPISYTSLHDLSFDYVLGLMIQEQREDIAAIERCAAELALAPRAREFAQEALGAAKAHLDSLQELNHADAVNS